MPPNPLPVKLLLPTDLETISSKRLARIRLALFTSLCLRRPSQSSSWMGQPCLSSPFPTIATTFIMTQLVVLLLIPPRSPFSMMCDMAGG